MLVAEFKRFCDFTPEAYLLIRNDGAIEAANQAAADWLGEPLAGTRIADRIEDPATAASYLELSARSRAFLPGACRLRARHGVEDCRTWAAFVGKSPSGIFVLLRLEPRDSPNRFELLNEHIRSPRLAAIHPLLTTQSVRTPERAYPSP